MVGWKKRFRGDLFQKIFQQYAELYVESKRSVKVAMDRLEELGIIRKEFREVTCGNGMILNNVMYIGLNADMLNQLTYPDRAPELKSYSVEVQETMDFVKGGTNTEITTLTTDRDYINPIYQRSNMPGRKVDMMDTIAAYTEEVRDNIDYDLLKQEYGPYDGMVDEIVNLLVETVSIERESIRIGGADYPYQLVKNRFLKLEAEHVRYVIDCLKKNTTQVDNIRAYLLMALYNAPGTIDSYYQARVNHDMYGRA